MRHPHVALWAQTALGFVRTVRELVNCSIAYTRVCTQRTPACLCRAVNTTVAVSHAFTYYHAESRPLLRREDNDVDGGNRCLAGRSV